VTNFGEKSGLYGKLQRFANEVHAANTSEYASLMKGVGIMPEGIHNNPVVFNLVLDLAWHREKVQVEEWIKAFVTARYGVKNESIQQAWQLFLETCYSSFDKVQEGPSESVFCARPSVNVTSVSSWGTRIRNYDTEKFKAAVKLFVSASKEMRGSNTYQIDMVDFVRQVLSNQGEVVYKEMVNAYAQQDISLFKERSSLFLSLIERQDSLLSCSEHFQLYHWLKQAQDFGKTRSEKELALKNAKIQITFWGPDDPKTDLHEYANKEWNGLMSSFYLPRWKMFTDNCVAKLEGRSSAEPNYFLFERNWCNKADVYKPMIRLGAAKQEQIVNRILNY
jgi:alpha-N-acetylglucosaminidase